MLAISKARERLEARTSCWPLCISPVNSHNIPYNLRSGKQCQDLSEDGLTKQHAMDIVWHRFLARRQATQSPPAWSLAGWWADRCRVQGPNLLSFHSAWNYQEHSAYLLPDDLYYLTFHRLGQGKGPYTPEGGLCWPCPKRVQDCNKNGKTWYSDWIPIRAQAWQFVNDYTLDGITEPKWPVTLPTVPNTSSRITYNLTTELLTRGGWSNKTTNHTNHCRALLHKGWNMPITSSPSSTFWIPWNHSLTRRLGPGTSAKKELSFKGGQKTEKRMVPLLDAPFGVKWQLDKSFLFRKGSTPCESKFKKVEHGQRSMQSAGSTSPSQVYNSSRAAMVGLTLPMICRPKVSGTTILPPPNFHSSCQTQVAPAALRVQPATGKPLSWFWTMNLKAECRGHVTCVGM